MLSKALPSLMFPRPLSGSRGHIMSDGEKQREELSAFYVLGIKVLLLEG